MRLKLVRVFVDLTNSGELFQTVGPATEKTRPANCAFVTQIFQVDLRTCIKPTLAPTQPAGPYHYISSKNRQQIGLSTSPQPYQKIPVLFIICTTSLSVNQILSVDLITVNIVLCFVFIPLFYAIWPHGHKNEIKVYGLLLSWRLIVCFINAQNDDDDDDDDDDDEYAMIDLVMETKRATSQQWL